MVARLVLSPLIPAIMNAFNVSKSGVGIVLTGRWGAYALFQFPGVLSPTGAGIVG